MSDQRIISVYVDEELRFRESMCIIGKSTLRNGRNEYTGDVVVGGEKSCIFLRNTDDLRYATISYNWVIWLREPTEEERSVVEGGLARPRSGTAIHNINDPPPRVRRTPMTPPTFEETFHG